VGMIVPVGALGADEEGDRRGWFDTTCPMSMALSLKNFGERWSAWGEAPGW
jgi:hypothetical protein